ncbi:hypothetical protein IHV10_22320 [Fictibacillus sp. 5RED26]|uniref:hypothetical protein n=1 Tax=Fictibacillus sp. 5RED26 TaxID=2745876 RepID=UPI0018CF29BF|nr:hypothetical protein [Fictibacillus sp. 5RED26]MBH0159109.1 hypothetical protein [Fictibacillus sp. 5RED26]
MQKSSFFNSVNGDRRYKAEDYANYFSKFITNGVFPNVAFNLQVVTDGTDMNVKLKAGAAWINGYMYQNTLDLVIPIDVADGLLNRIDRIVIQLNFAERLIQAVVKKGEFASTPVAIPLQRDADIYELGIADVLVSQGVTSILQSAITDLRLNNTFCGLVNSLLQADTTAIFNQYQSWFEQTSEDHEQEFQTWFESVKGQLSGDVAGNLANRITEVETDLGVVTSRVTEAETDLTQISEDLIAHKADGVSHITGQERTDWNAKETPDGARKKVEQTDFKVYKSGKDANGIFTTIEYRRQDDTLAVKSVLSGGTSPLYTTRTLTYYGLNGTTVEKTRPRTLTYDADGILISEV